jgi:predicted SAM-dependent methyltransferase
MSSAARRRLCFFEPPYKLHIGCGSLHFDGWINVDLNDGPNVDIVWNVTRPFPTPDGTCQYVYSEHFLEHMLVEDGVRFLRDCHRVLMPGGVLRIAMPSVAEPVRQYYEDDWREKPWMEKYGYTWIRTRAELINIAFRHWGHQWLYDREELHRRLKEAGFQAIEDVEWGQSTYEELRNRETRDESLLVCEAIR